MSVKKLRKARTVHQGVIRIAFDDSMYLIALVTPILTIPQLLLVWMQRETAGVSLITWGSYAAMSGVWLIYGILHKQKQLVLSQVLLFVLGFGVVLGVSIFQR